MEGGLFSSRSFNRALPWLAGGVLLIGVLAFWQTQIRSDDPPETFSSEPAKNVAADKTVPLPPEARADRRPVHQDRSGQEEPP